MNKFIKVPISFLILALPSWGIANESNMGSLKTNTQTRANGDKSEFSSGVDISQWAIGKLQRIGIYYPLEISHTSFPKSDLVKILDRVSKGFRESSCKVIYDKKSLSAKCITMEQIQFLVSFYQDRTDPDVILMEVQRRSGDSITFNLYYVDYILSLVNEENPNFYFHSKDDNLAKILDLLELDVNVKTKEVNEAFKISYGLVMNDRLDAIRLGLESFVTLTNPSRVALETSFKIVRSLLKPKDAENGELVQTLLNFALGESTEEFRFLALQV